jgi:hypothetical protein
MTAASTGSTNHSWPSLPYEAWQDTCATLHRWTQIVGKIRVAQTPWVNHQWHVVLYVTARGLTTSPIPYQNRVFEIDFDLLNHVLDIRTNHGQELTLPLTGQSVADFHAAVLGALAELDIHVRIHGTPNEIPGAIPFSEDRAHRVYEPEQAQRFCQVLLQVDRVFKRFRSGFLGKVSPVQLFWGSFDLAVTRFSGRPAPLHPGGVPGLPDAITREAYSHEVSSAGFWPGGGLDYPAFYSYAYPEPSGFRGAAVQPESAFFHEAMGEFILPYESVCTADAPDEVLLEFLQSTYAAAADLGGWDRAALECPFGLPRVPRAI